jgi:hypothetical protein
MYEPLQLSSRLMSQRLTFGVFLAAAALVGAWVALVFTPRVDVVAVIPAPDSTGQVATLTGQLELLVQVNEQMATMVSTSIQVVVVIALGLAAFSWFTNNRQYERDMATISREAKDQIAVVAEQQKLALQREIEASKVEQNKLLDEFKKTQSQIANAARAEAKGIGEELLDLKDDYWWTRHLTLDREGEAAFGAKSGYKAFDAFLSSFEALRKHRYSGYGGVHSSFSAVIDQLEKTVRELKYRPDGAELSKLDECLKDKEIPEQAQSAIERLRKAIESVRV